MEYLNWIFVDGPWKGKIIPVEKDRYSLMVEDLNYNIKHLYRLYPYYYCNKLYCIAFCGWIPSTKDIEKYVQDNSEIGYIDNTRTQC